MKILGFDSSGPVASVAIAEEDALGYRKLIGGFRLQSGFTHSQTLMPMLETMKELAGIDLKEIDYVAVASGPGSFTGLRIGASAAKGLAFALEKPVVPVPTLDAMAYQMAGVQGLVCPMMDARRQQVYTGVYCFEEKDTSAEPGMAGNVDSNEDGNRRDRNGGTTDTGEIAWKMKHIIKPCAIAVEELIAELNRLGIRREDGMEYGEVPCVHLLGDGVPVYVKELEEGLAIPYSVVPFHRDRQSSEAVCALAFELVHEGKVMDADAFAPEYIRSGPQPVV